MNYIHLMYDKNIQSQKHKDDIRRALKVCPKNKDRRAELEKYPILMKATNCVWNKILTKALEFSSKFEYKIEENRNSFEKFMDRNKYKISKVHRKRGFRYN